MDEITYDNLEEGKIGVNIDGIVIELDHIEHVLDLDMLLLAMRNRVTRSWQVKLAPLYELYGKTVDILDPGLPCKAKTLTEAVETFKKWADAESGFLSGRTDALKEFARRNQIPALKTGEIEDNLFRSAYIQGWNTAAASLVELFGQTW
jgi:hypothetical protein